MNKSTMQSYILALALPALALACSDPEPVGSCSANLSFRACSGSAIDTLALRAHIGTIEGDAMTGYSLTVASDPLDFRYGAVFVTNGTADTLTIKLTPENVEGGGFVEGTGVVEQEVPANENAWVTLDETTERVAVFVSDDGGMTFPYSDTVVMTSDDDPAAVAGNVVELNCGGIRRFDSDEDGVGHFRDYVSVREGSGQVVIRNISDPPAGTGDPYYCVYAATLDSSASCPDWTDPRIYEWSTVALSDCGGASLTQVGPGEEACVADAASYAALGFVLVESGASCPTKQAAIDAAFDTPDEVAPGTETQASSEWTYTGRKVIRIADTTQNMIRIEEVEDCSGATGGAHVPVGVPFVATDPCEPDINGDDSYEYELFNCTPDIISFTDNGNEVCMLPEAGGTCGASCATCLEASEQPYIYTTQDGALETISWDDNGDPTIILKKKTGTCNGG